MMDIAAPEYRADLERQALEGLRRCGAPRAQRDGVGRREAGIHVGGQQRGALVEPPGPVIECELGMVDRAVLMQPDLDLAMAGAPSVLEGQVRPGTLARVARCRVDEPLGDVVRDEVAQLVERVFLAPACGQHDVEFGKVPKHGITSGEHGELVDFFDREGLVSRIVELLDDPVRRDLLGIQARRRAAECDDLKTVCLPQQLEWIKSLLPQRVEGGLHSCIQCRS